MGKRKKLSSMNLERYSYREAIHKEVKVHCRILIVCEGEKTEPSYFKSFDQMQYGSVVYEIECEGGKINTMQVVDKAIELRDKAFAAGSSYDAVWAVFDKDDFPAFSFNAAIIKAEQHGIGCAWSNEAFKKNDSKSRAIMTTYGDEARAIRFAKSQADSFGDTRYALHNPSTTVYKLVRVLRGEDEEFNKRIMEDLFLNL